MFNALLTGFARDEQGGGTIMGLIWFMLLVAFTGLAVDVTDGFRNRTMMQATADAAALAAAIDLPDDVQAVNTATAYAATNMGTDLYGSVLEADDVKVGLWVEATKTFIEGAPLPDAVMVSVRRAAQNNNAVPLNFLRILGLETWNVNVRAIAQKFIPICLNDGLIARGVVDISSNNGFVNHICIHGQEGVHMQNHNFHELGVIVSMPNRKTMLEIPAGGMESNPGLPEALRDQILDPRMVNHVDEMMLAMINQGVVSLDNGTVLSQADVLPDYMTESVEAAAVPIVAVDEKFDLGTVQPGNIYHVQCKPNKNASIPNNAVIHDVVIIAECELHIGTSALIYNAVLGSRSGGNGSIDKANVSASAKVQLGAPDNCTPGGGVQVFSNATIHTASTTTINGVQMVATGDIELGAQDYGINGISAQSGGNITLTSNNQFGLCSGNVDAQFTVPYYRLVY